MKYKYIVDIIIPIISGVLSGLLTVIGVIITIKYESKKEKKNKIEEIKPLFYVLDQGMRNGEQFNTFVFSENKEDTGNNVVMDGIIKNTDKIPFIINYIVIKEEKFFPVYGNVIDKNKSVRVMVRNDKKLNDNRAVLHVSDIYNNEHIYEIILEDRMIKNINERSTK